MKEYAFSFFTRLEKRTISCVAAPKRKISEYTVSSLLSVVVIKRKIYLLFAAENCPRIS